MSLDITPHLQTVARGARLLGLVRGLHHAVFILQKHGESFSPAIDDIRRMLLVADEELADQEVSKYWSDKPARDPDVGFGPVFDRLDKFSEPAA
jgi:hypothetical protein